jgi:hypothetical protein
MPGMYDVQNIFHNYMSNLSKEEIPFSETRHYLVKLYEPNFYIISTGHKAKFGELENIIEMTETAKFQSSVPCNFLAGRNGCIVRTGID